MASVTCVYRFLLRNTVLAALVLWGSASLAEHYSLPLFVTSTAPGTAHGMLRIVNGSGDDGSVGIHAVDDAGARYGPATFTLIAGTAVEFDASDLASGNAMKGLSPGLGRCRATCAWRSRRSCRSCRWRMFARRTGR